MSTYDDFMSGMDPSNWSKKLATIDPTVNKAAQGDAANAQGYLGQAAGAFKDMTPPDLKKVNPTYASQTKATATNAGPSDFNNISVNPRYNAAQEAQMAALANIAARGGRSAASDANLARIQQEENTNARGQRDAIMAGANARGQGGGGAALLAQLSSSQNATNNQSARDMDVAGMESNAAIQAGQGAANIGAGLHGQAYTEAANRASANDAINRFNAGNTTGVGVFNAGQANETGRFNAGASNHAQEFNTGLDQTTFQDKMGIAGGNQAGGKIGTDYWGNKYKEDTAAKGNMLGGVMQMGTALAPAAMKAFGGGAAPSTAGLSGASATGLAGAGGVAGGGAAGEAWAGGAGADAAGYGSEVAGYGSEAAPYAADAGEVAMAAWGGKTPGRPVVPGNSTLNDIVPMMSSPGEVHVPPDLVQKGTPNQIGQYVKHAPTLTHDPAQNKEAMLSALKNISARRRAA